MGEQQGALGKGGVVFIATFLSCAIFMYQRLTRPNTSELKLKRESLSQLEMCMFKEEPDLNQSIGRCLKRQKKAFEADVRRH